MITEQELRNRIPELSNMLETFKKSKDDLEALRYFGENTEKEIQNSYSKYLNQYLLERTGTGVRPGYKHSDFNLSFNSNNYDLDTVVKTYSLMEYEKSEYEIRSLYDATYKNLNKSIEYIKPILKNGFLWFFTSKEKKELSVKAANYLLNLQSKSFLNDLSRLNESINSIDKTKAFDEFVNDEDRFIIEINKVVDSNVYSEEDPEKPDFDQLHKDGAIIAKTYDSMASCINKVDEMKQDVVKKANIMLDHEITSALKDIPVDQLNKDKIGIKVNVLKNAGIKTVYDAYKTAPWKIASIYGISEDASYIISGKAKELRNECANNLKLRFNVDEKTKEATNLINSLHTYIKNKEIIKELDNLNNECFSKAIAIINKASKYGDDYDWYKGTYKDKNLVHDGAAVLHKVVLSDYLDKAEDLKGRFSINEESLDNKQLWDFYSENSAKCYSELDELCPGLFGSSDTYFGLPEELAKQIEEECIFPDGLLVTLRRYQEWGVKYILHQRNVLLGDEMGLGKTIQAIATMVSLKNVGAKHFAVVCPASVIINWCREIETHSKLKSIKVHGAGKKVAFNQWIENGGVAVTTYESTSTFKFDDNFKFTLATIDEAHYCKNPEARRTINVRTLCSHAERTLYMTGTALENNVDEMIELISHLQPSIAEEAGKYSFMQAHETFKEKVAPVYYRRKREDVLTELPELTISKEWCSLSKKEYDKYTETLLSRNYPSVRKVSWNVDDLNDSSKANRLKEIIADAKDDNRRVIVFSFFLETIKKIERFLGPICTQPINGSVNPQRRQEIIDAFDKSEAGSVLLAQIQAGGTGLNIQSASVIVLCEPQFKPSVENQAISRAYRMGQTRNVLVYRLLSEDTVDERLMEVLEEKQAIFDAFADESVAAQAEKTEIDEKTFGNIIQEEIDRLKLEQPTEVNENSSAIDLN